MSDEREVAAPRAVDAGRKRGLAPHEQVALWVFLFFALLYVSMTRGRFISIDEVNLYQVTRSLWESGNLRVASTCLWTQRGPDGGYYNPYGVGYSVAAIPLYALGSAVGEVLGQLGLSGVIGAIAGPVLGDSQMAWGGSPEIVFVNLLNAVLTALLCAVFLCTCIVLGASFRAAGAATVLVGLATYVGGLSNSAFPHSGEALFLLWSVFFLCCDTVSANWRARLAAGLMLTATILFRVQAVIVAPVLGLYLVRCAWRRQAPGSSLGRRLLGAAGEAAPFGLGTSVGLGITLVVNHLKTGKFQLVNDVYGAQEFHNHLIRGAWGFLLSPGHSIFIFSPLLLVMPWAMAHLRKRHGAEVLLFLGVALAYLLVYSRYSYWHGLFCYGPRYLLATVPVLLLPLASWIDHRGLRAWIALVPLALFGAWVQATAVAVNWWTLIVRAKLPALTDQSLFQRADYLFVPDGQTPLVAHSRALLSGDDRVDLWLLSLGRASGWGVAVAVSLPLMLGLWYCLRRLRRSVPAADESWGRDRHFAGLRRVVVGLLLFTLGATSVGVVVDRRHRSGLEAEVLSSVRATDVDRAMAAGLDALNRLRRPYHALVIFRRVLEVAPAHAAARMQVAVALEALGRNTEAVAVWRHALEAAVRRGDQETEQVARRHLRVVGPG